MMRIPFTKLHGAENDFLFTWREEAPRVQLAEIARRICARNTGLGADGWMLVAREGDRLNTRLFNADGSEAEISGNGTRCAAAFGILEGALTGTEVTITTLAGRKELRLLERSGNRFIFEMNMGEPRVLEIRTPIQLNGQDFDATILDVGNPQCAIFTDKIPENWRSAASECESHVRFSRRTNVSFVRPVDRHTIEAVFFERGAGETRSSGTGSTGAACAAILRGIADTPVTIRAPAGELTLRWNDSVYLTGPAEVIGEGVFFVDY